MNIKPIKMEKLFMESHFKILLLIITICGFLFSAEIKIADFKISPPSQPYPKNECLVKFEKGISEDTIKKLGNIFGFHILSYYRFGKFFKISIPRNSTIEQFVIELKKHPSVRYAHPDYYMKAMSNPNDPFFRYQWNLGDIHSGGIQYGLANSRIQAVPSDAVIAILDGGIAFENYDNFKKAPELSNTTFVKGFDFVNFDNHPNDDLGHGTHIATLIAGLTNNGYGAAGIIPGVAILPVKVIDSKGIGKTSDITEGIYFAVAQGASILNISIGGPDSPLLRDAVSMAFKRGVLSVCAAGNGSSLVNDSVFFPAAYNDYCIAVGAHGMNGIPVPYSIDNNYIDISAPGGIIGLDLNSDGIKDGILQQTFLKEPSSFGFYVGEGSSYSAAHVSAVSALLKSIGIDGVDKIHQALEMSCFDREPAGWDRKTGWGFLDAAGALSYFPELKHDIIISSVKAPQWCIKGEQINVIVNIKNQGAYTESTIISIYDSLTLQMIGSSRCVLKPGEIKKNIFVWNTEKELNDYHLLKISAQLSTDQDPGDNIFYKEIGVINNCHDIAITGVDYEQQKGKKELTTVVQVSNIGTYNEFIRVDIKDYDGSVLGYKDTSIDAMSDIKVPVKFDPKSKLIETDSIQVLIQDGDRQDINLKNNSMIVPFGFSGD